MENDVPLAETLKRRLKRLRDEETEAKRAVRSAVTSIAKQQVYRGATGFKYLEENITATLVVKEHVVIQLCSDVPTVDAK